MLEGMLFEQLGDEQPRLARARHWKHLIYADLIENTRVVEICRKLTFDLLHDEVHGAVSDRTQQWLRTTEDLFFRDGNSSLVRPTCYPTNLGLWSSKYPGLPRASSCANGPGHTAGSVDYPMGSEEYGNCAVSNGWAQYVSASVWNRSDQADCTYRGLQRQRLLGPRERPGSL